MECVIPLVMGSFLKKSSGSGSYKHADLFLAEYDQFDDYLEMVVQFGVNDEIMPTLLSSFCGQPSAL